MIWPGDEISASAPALSAPPAAGPIGLAGGGGFGGGGGELQLHVNIGEIKAGRGAETLRVTLGSCVGIGLVWKRQGCAALAHCLLPAAPPGQGPGASPLHRSEPQGKYVDRAVPALLALLRVPRAALGEVEALLVGGGEMNPGAVPGRSIGSANVAAARAALRKIGVPIVHEDVGGPHGRSIRLACAAGTLDVQILSKE